MRPCKGNQCVQQSFLSHIFFFSSYIVADRKSDSTCLEGKCHFLKQNVTIEGVFYGSLSQFTMTYFLFFTRETKFYPTVPQRSTVSALQRTERADTVYLVGSAHF